MQFPACASLYVLLWVVFLTALGMLGVAIRDTWRESFYPVERPQFRVVMWNGDGEVLERRGSQMEKGEIVVGEGGD